MATFVTDLSLPRKIEEFVEARDKAIALLKVARRETERASEVTKEFLPLYGLPADSFPRAGIKEITRELDRRFWRVTFEKAGFMQYMDQEAKADFDRELDNNPPEYSMDNIRSTLVSAASDAQMMFRRGLVNVFRTLHGIYYNQYETNRKEPFKVGRKCVLEFIFERDWNGSGLSVNYHHRGKINDIDRVFKVLAGDIHVPSSLQSALDGHFKEGPFSMVGAYEDEYYRIKGFKKGTMHIEFKRADLLEKANLLIAEHFADGALPDARHAA